MIVKATETASVEVDVAPASTDTLSTVGAAVVPPPPPPPDEPLEPEEELAALDDFF